MMSQGSRDSASKKLAQEEEWLKLFKENIRKSAEIRDSIVQISDSFQRRITSLEVDVLPMHETNSLIQIKQNNIQRLIKTIDATVQFYGRTNEVERFVRDCSPAQDLGAYLDQMDSLCEAIQFFENHKNYQSQLDSMRITLETGFAILEKEYLSLVTRGTTLVDPMVLIDHMDEDYCINDNRLKEISVLSLKNADKVCRLGTWLLKRGRTKHLTIYADVRCENVMKTLHSVQQHYSVLHSRYHAAVKSNRRHAANAEVESAVNGTRIDSALLSCACLLALLQIEEQLMSKTIADTKRQAQVFRDLVGRPYSFVIHSATASVQECDTNVCPLLPLLKFLAQHQARFQNIATNSASNVSFDSLVRQLKVKCSTAINELVERLKSEANTFVPLDGNVHTMTASTISVLSVLTMYRHTVANEILSSGLSSSLALPKLFARILSSLGNALKEQSALYGDPTMSSIFLLNNYKYIAKTMEDKEEGLLPVINDQNTQILSFYHGEMSKCIQKYLQCWNPCVTALSSLDNADERTLRQAISVFNRQFDDTLSRQKSYCIADDDLAREVKEKVKAAIIPTYTKLVSKGRLDKDALQYTPDNLHLLIDKMFDVSK